MRYELTETLSELLGVEIPERNRNAQLLCPFHDERTPSFSLNLDTGQFQCFGCGSMGGLNKLARMLGGELDESTRQDILIRSLSRGEEAPARRNLAPVANGYIQAAQSERGQALLRDYLERRGLPDSVAVDFGLGYDESRECIALPYWDSGEVTGIKFRSRDSHKYSYDGSTYGLYNVDDLRGKPVVVLGEGESDTHQLWHRLRGVVHGREARGRAGDTARDNDSGEPEGVVGVGGTSGAVKSERLWQLWSLDLLFARKVFICYDNDEPGDTAFEVAKRFLREKAVRIKPPREGDDVTKHFQNGGTLEELGLDQGTLAL